MSRLPRVPGWMLLLLVWGSVALEPSWGAPPPPPAETQITRWIEQLGDKDFAVRQQAQEDLAKLRFAAFEALQAATQHEDLEIATRARYLLGLMRMHWSDDADPPEIRQALRDYEAQGLAGRYQRIFDLARVRNDAGVLALARLVRYESSEVLSKLAALEILNRQPLERQDEARLAQALRAQLGTSSRPAAKWALADLALRENPAAAEATWLEQIDAEQELAQKESHQTNANILVALFYHLAEVQAQQGRAAPADATAQRARQLNPGTASSALIAHLSIAVTLKHRGRFAWAEQEFLEVVQAKLQAPRLAYRAQAYRADMWHDQGRDRDAAEALRQALAIQEEVGAANLPEAFQTADQLRARMNYYLACHWEAQGDRPKQLQCLELALANDPKEVDSLIAAWQLPDVPADFRIKVQLLIERATGELRRDLGNPPEDADACNLFAWLVGNTHGNLDEALRYSQRSLELAPNNGAYYDTLAHVYFAQGDWDRAVENQVRAHELDPHSGLIAKELQRFRAERERQQSVKTAASGTEASGKSTPAPAASVPQ